MTTKLESPAPGASALLPCPCGAPCDTDEGPYPISRNNDLFRLDCERADCGWSCVSPTPEQCLIDWNTRAGAGDQAVADLIRWLCVHAAKLESSFPAERRKTCGPLAFDQLHETAKDMLFWANATEHLYTHAHVDRSDRSDAAGKGVEVTDEMLADLDGRARFGGGPGLDAVEWPIIRQLIVANRAAKPAQVGQVGNKELEQALIDPENQPSQWGTIPLSMLPDEKADPFPEKVLGGPVDHDDWREYGEYIGWNACLRAIQSIGAVVPAQDGGV